MVSCPVKEPRSESTMDTKPGKKTDNSKDTRVRDAEARQEGGRREVSRTSPEARTVAPATPGSWSAPHLDRGAGFSGACICLNLANCALYSIKLLTAASLRQAAVRGGGCQSGPGSSGAPGERGRPQLGGPGSPGCFRVAPSPPPPPLQPLEYEVSADLGLQPPCSSVDGVDGE